MHRRLRASCATITMAGSSASSAASTPARPRGGRGSPFTPRAREAEAPRLNERVAVFPGRPGPRLDGPGWLGGLSDGVACRQERAALPEDGRVLRHGEGGPAFHLAAAA